MLKNPNLLESWSVLPDDNALSRVAFKQYKITKNKDASILEYQNNQLTEALSFVKNFNVAIDGGANYGLMSYHLSQRFNKVHAFEIEPSVRDCLKENIKKFSLDNVIIYDCGLGETDHNVKLAYGKTSFSTHIDPLDTVGNIPVTSIDSLDLSDLNFLKLDCEGYEPFILKGAKDTIQKFQPVILMERKGHTERWNLSKYEPVSILESWGYEEKVSYEKDCIMVPKCL